MARRATAVATAKPKKAEMLAQPFTQTGIICNIFSITDETHNVQYFILLTNIYIDLAML